MATTHKCFHLQAFTPPPPLKTPSESSHQKNTQNTAEIGHKAFLLKNLKMNSYIMPRFRDRKRALQHHSFYLILRMVTQDFLAKYLKHNIWRYTLHIKYMYIRRHMVHPNKHIYGRIIYILIYAYIYRSSFAISTTANMITSSPPHF